MAMGSWTIRGGSRKTRSQGWPMNQTLRPTAPWKSATRPASPEVAMAS